MRLRIGRARVALIVAPHADDETIGAFALIGALRRRGARVRVLVVTDGAASHPASVAWPSRRLVAERQRETRRAMRAHGIGAGDVAFLDLPDGGLATLPPKRRAAIGRAVRRVRELDLLVGPSSRDDHPDHRVVAAVIRDPSRGVRRIAYLVWPGARAPRAGPQRLLPVASTLAKRAAIRRYRTQTGCIVDDPGGFAIAPHELARFAASAERYEVVR